MGSTSPFVPIDPIAYICDCTKIIFSFLSEKYIEPSEKKHLSTIHFADKIQKIKKREKLEVCLLSESFFNLKFLLRKNEKSKQPTLVRVQHPLRVQEMPEPAVPRHLTPLDLVDLTRSLLIDAEFVAWIFSFFKDSILNHNIDYKIDKFSNRFCNLYADLNGIFILRNYSLLACCYTSYAFGFLFSYFITKLGNIFHRWYCKCHRTVVFSSNYFIFFCIHVNTVKYEIVVLLLSHYFIMPSSPHQFLLYLSSRV